MTSDPELFSEFMRPTELEDLILPKRERDALQGMIDQDDPMNLLFYGPPGHGKTSAARILLQKIGKELAKEANGASLSRVEDVRTIIHGWAFGSILPIHQGRKMWFIDEADYMSKKAQAALRGVIEKSYRHCRFILAANTLNDLDEAVRSRLKPIAFVIATQEKPSVIDRLQRRAAAKLDELGISFDHDRLHRIVVNYFPDLRMINSEIQFEFGYGK
jgi:replication-associated recombination protein RarA